MTATCSYVVQRKSGRGYKSAYCSHKALPHSTVCHVHTASAIAKRDAKADAHWAQYVAQWEARKVAESLLYTR
jgi:hypothetical protein